MGSSIIHDHLDRTILQQRFECMARGTPIGNIEADTRRRPAISPNLHYHLLSQFRMPMGMHTIIGEGGTTFSGGQRQRLLIARAIVRRPRILLLDEATSALDNPTQEIVSNSLARLQATRIVIAHRLSTVAAADRVYVVAGGRIAQSGTFAELAGQEGLFRALMQRQLS